MRVGVPSTNENNWAVGHILRDIAAEHGIEPDRLLTEKTNPDPTVSAPHCIAHYPMAIFDACCERVASIWQDKSRQYPLF
jgi:hypothetical protein